MGSSSVERVEGVLNAYRHSLGFVNLSGPTHLQPIMHATLEKIKSMNDQKNLNYYVLLVITDGQTDDMDETTKAIIEASKYPISIIIIGVGDGDFRGMEKLDEGAIPNTKRNISQFVTSKQFNGDNEKLTQCVLSGIPLQIQEYYKGLGILPGTSTKSDL